MRSVRIFSSEQLCAESTASLTGTAARHIAQVLRMNAGDHLSLFDNSGAEYPATIVASTKSRVDVAVGLALTPPVESPVHITLWHGLCRGGRMDTVVQKATELGVTAIQPVVTEHGVVRLDHDRGNKKAEHWRNIAISACEQSGRVRVPVIFRPQRLSECMHKLPDNSAEQARLMFDPAGSPGLPKPAQGAQSLIALTGPEGGFSPAEKDMAINAGFALVALGPRILRTETAPLVALSLIQSTIGDL